MKLFVFIPSKEWDFCGGAVILSGDTFDELQEIMDRYQKDEWESKPRTEWERLCRELLYEQEPNEDDGADKWVLYATFDCPNVTEKKVILINYNYA